MMCLGPVLNAQAPSSLQRLDGLLKELNQWERSPKDVSLEKIVASQLGESHLIPAAKLDMRMTKAMASMRLDAQEAILASAATNRFLGDKYFKNYELLLVKVKDGEALRLPDKKLVNSVKEYHSTKRRAISLLQAFAKKSELGEVRFLAQYASTYIPVAHGSIPREVPLDKAVTMYIAYGNYELGDSWSFRYSYERNRGVGIRKSYPVEFSLFNGEQIFTWLVPLDECEKELGKSIPLRFTKWFWDSYPTGPINDAANYLCPSIERKQDVPKFRADGWKLSYDFFVRFRAITQKTNVLRSNTHRSILEHVVALDDTPVPPFDIGEKSFLRMEEFEEMFMQEVKSNPKRAVLERAARRLADKYPFRKDEINSRQEGKK